jgi:hypothetical protein
MTVDKSMPIKAIPYKHQIEAFKLACRLFGLMEGGGTDDGDVCDLRNANTAETKPIEKNK